MDFPIAKDLLIYAYSLHDEPEALLQFLKESGVSKIRSIITYSEVMEIPIDEAKKTVHFSPAWADQKDKDEKIQEALL